MLRSRGWALFWTVLRAAIVVLIGAAVVAQLSKSITGAVDNGRNVPTTIANFFSFFTVLSNVGTLVVMTWAVVWYFTRPRDAAREPRSLAIAIAAISSYMIVTGLVYNLLLRSVALPQGTTVPWSNEVLHVVGPLFLLADVFLAPHRRILPWRAIAEVIAFPVVWAVYTLIRGPLTVNPSTGDAWWYPYPFLDPNLPGGYGRVALYVLGISIAIGAVAAFVVWMTRRRGSLADAVAHPTPVASAG